MNNDVSKENPQETKKERIDRELLELLQELRVAFQACKFSSHSF